MAYILGLFLILALIFSSFGHISLGKNMFGDMTSLLGEKIENLKAKIAGFIFPKTEREILIENLESEQKYLDKFFKETAPEILKSKDISSKNKEIIRGASVKFSENQEHIEQLKNLAKDNDSIIKTLLKKILPEDKKPGPIEPTSIPPQCRLECD